MAGRIRKILQVTEFRVPCTVLRNDSYGDTHRSLYGRDFKVEELPFELPRNRKFDLVFSKDKPNGQAIQVRLNPRSSKVHYIGAEGKNGATESDFLYWVEVVLTILRIFGFLGNGPAVLWLHAEV